MPKGIVTLKGDGEIPAVLRRWVWGAGGNSSDWKEPRLGVPQRMVTLRWEHTEASRKWVWGTRGNGRVGRGRGGDEERRVGVPEGTVTL